MKTINETTRQRIQDRIADAERQCDSELVCLITKNSARYRLFPLLFAALIALILPVVQVFPGFDDLTGTPITFQHQTLLFVILAAGFVFTPLSHKLTPKWLRHQNCDRFSTEQFFRHQLHETAARNAVLIFVSWDEKYVTVIADKGIDAEVQQGDWDRLVSDFVTDVKANEIEAGFLRIIDGAGALLIRHFPAKTEKTDELPNHLIELDGPGYYS